MIEIKNLNKTYNYGSKNAYQALFDINLTISDGELVAIIGKSGAGKSTLLHIIGAIDSYESGSCTLDGVALENMSEKELAGVRNEKIGIVLQDFALIEDYTVEENVGLPLRFCKIKAAQYKAKVRDALEAVGIPELALKEVNKLSGGQKQRVAIARAIVNDPSFILADEPTGALDTKTGQGIIKLLEELNSKGRTVIIITHDMQIAQSCKRMIVIEDGRIV
ncbi:MAG: ABC transporter ATP-binding protein [Lachnospiraceae bacterium]|nr:ABC transporter ATP-binding protein [Lachnospiraceae bacterium]